MAEKEKRANVKMVNHSRHSVEYIFNIVIHVALIYVVFHLNQWFKVFTDSFQAIAWLLAISYSAEIVAYFIYLFYDNGWFKSLTQLAINVFNLIIFYTALVIFPFSLNVANEMIARIIIYIIIFGTAVAILVEVTKLLKYLFSKIGEEENERSA